MMASGMRAARSAGSGSCSAVYGVLLATAGKGQGRWWCCGGRKRLAESASSLC